MQVGFISKSPASVTVSTEKVSNFSKTERKFLGLFYKSTAFFTLLAVILTVRQMGQALDGPALTWAVVSTGSVGAAMGLLFALAHDVIIKGRLES